ncbi:MAG: hypothetical protein ACC662_06560 [Planctomycetota bacterium]
MPSPGAGPTHRAPSPDPRPRSRLATWSLVLGLVLSVASIVLAFMWILLLPPLLLAAWALWKIRPQTVRGQGMAIAALVISLLAGSCSYISAKAMRGTAAYLGRGVLSALAGKDEGRLKAWFTKKAQDDGSMEKVRARFAAAVAEVGKYRQAVETGAPWLGARPVIYPPADVEELGGDPEHPWKARPGALWVLARFEKGPLHVEVKIGEGGEGKGDAGALEKAFQGAQGQEPSAVVSDVHFLRVK